MSIVRGIRKAASGPGAALGGVLTSSSVYGPDGFLDVKNISLSRDRAMKLSTVNRCVEVRSCTVAALPPILCFLFCSFLRGCVSREMGKTERFLIKVLQFLPQCAIINSASGNDRRKFDLLPFGA